MRLSPAAVGLAALAGLAAWVSLGTLAVASAAPGAPRLGLLPPWWALGLLLATALAGVSALDRRGWPRTPWLLSALTLLPWLPGPVPTAFLIWSGPIVWLVWAGVGVGLVAGHDRGGRPLARAVVDPRRAPITAAAAGFVVFATASWFAAPSVPGGDEPHYLIITQSLLRDFDLKIENNHARREFAEYLSLDEFKPDFLRRGANGEIYSIHAPGLPALVAPAFAAGGHRGVEVLLLVLSALGASLVWRLAWRATGDAGAAWFGWAAVCLSPTWVFHTFTVYPDGVGALLTLVGVWALVRLGALDAGEPAPRARELALHGAALAALPWLHTRFALIAASLGLLIAARIVRRYAWREALRAVAAFVAVPIVGAACWFAFFWFIYGTPDPRVPYGGRAGGQWEYVTSGLGGLFFDQQFGLLAYAPVVAAGLGGLVLLAADKGRRRLAVELAVVMTPYLLAVTHFRMWWAGWSVPARFFTPILLPLAIPVALAWSRTRSRASRAVMGSALAFTALATTVMAVVDGGRLAYNVRDGFALWLEWLARLADLPRALPSFHRTAEGAAFVHVAIWVAAVTAAWAALRMLEKTRAGRRVSMAGAAPLALAAAAMAAATAVWRSNDATGLTPAAAQLDLLRASAGGRGVAVGDGSLGRLRAADLAARLSIETSPRYLRSPNRPFFVLPNLPAGDYRLRVETGPDPAGTLDLAISWEPFVLARTPVADVAAGGGVVEVAYPVAVCAIVVRADEPARASVTRMALEPASLVPPSARVAEGTATQAVVYPGGTVYFMDDGAIAEPDAFWVVGRAAARIVVSPRASEGGGTGPLDLFVRNAPVENRLTVQAGNWREDVALSPGEERRLSIPLVPGRRAVAVRLETTAGFRPSEVEPGSQDSRFLGVWVEVRD